MRIVTVFVLTIAMIVVLLGCGVAASNPKDCVHDYYLSDHEPSSTEQNGYNIYTCKKCGNTYKEIIPAIKVPAAVTETPKPNSIDMTEKIDVSKYSSKTELFSLELYSSSSSIYNPKYTAEALDAKGYKHEDVYTVNTSWGGEDYFRYELNGKYEVLTGTIYIMDAINGLDVVWLDFYNGEDYLFSTKKLSDSRLSDSFEIDIRGVDYLTVYPRQEGFYGNPIITENFFLYK